jgi:hypothetical protein
MKMVKIPLMSPHARTAFHNASTSGVRRKKASTPSIGRNDVDVDGPLSKSTTNKQVLNVALLSDVFVVRHVNISGM